MPTGSWASRIWRRPARNDKVDFEELPFRINPPIYAFYVISQDVSLPVERRFHHEERIIYPTTAQSVRIQDARGVHEVPIAEVVLHDADAGLKPADAGADYCVFSWIGINWLMIAKCDAIVPAVYTKVFGPASEAACQQYVKSHGGVGLGAHKPIRPLQDTFRAWIDKMPMAEPKLIVVGDVEANTGGWHARLTPAVPLAFNPRILILDLETTPPVGPAPTVISTIPVRFEERPPRYEYTQVTIRHDGAEFSLGVGHTH